MLEKKGTMGTSHFGRTAAIYLLGLLLGGLYVGIIAPLRTAIQAQMGIDSTQGIWMINIYTLFYASTILISGNLADRYGRNKVFSACLCLFVVGALLCGLSQWGSSFELLIFGRIVQALGAGGVIPVATAEMGVSAPEEKRGMWLGIASAVAGIANVIGAAVGSLVVSLVGLDGWCWAFFMAVPVGLILVVCGFVFLPKSNLEPRAKLDFVGAVLFTIFVLSLLWGIKGLQVEDGEVSSLVSSGIVLIVAILVFLIFRKVENKAEDPIFSFEYLHSKSIVIVMAISFFVGCCIISMTLVPEVAESALDLEPGTGGFYMAVIGIFAIFGPPLCGKFVDKYGPKPVLAGGLIVTMLGFILLAYFVIYVPSVVTIILGLAVIGLGMGFTMGTPLNYMILENTAEDEATSAVATIALVRQMGTTLAPAILISFTAMGLGIAGYGYMLIAVAVINLVSLLLLIPYHSPEK